MPLDWFSSYVVLRAFYSKKPTKFQDGAAESSLGDMIEFMNKEYKVDEVFEAVRAVSEERKSCLEAYELILKLNVDPTRGD